MPRKQKIPDSVRSALKKQAVEGEIREPDMGRLVSAFFDAAGGERAVAKLLYGEFVAAKEGSLTRQRILDMVLRATARVNDRNGTPDDLGVLSHEDLAREFEEIVRTVSDDAEEITPGPARPAGQPPEVAERGPADPG